MGCDHLCCYFVAELDDGEPEGATADADDKVEEKEQVASKLPQEVQNIVQVAKTRYFLLVGRD